MTYSVTTKAGGVATTILHKEESMTVHAVIEKLIINHNSVAAGNVSLP